MKKKSNTQLIWEFLYGCKRYFAVFIIAQLVTSLCQMLTPQIVRSTIDNVLGGKEADFPAFVMRIVEKAGGFAYIADHLWIMAAALMAVATVQFVSNYVGRVYNTKAAESLSRAMRNRLFGHIQKLPYDWHMKNHTGDIIQRCTSDIQTLRNFLAEQLTALLLTVLKIAMGLYFMFSMNVRLSLYAMIPIPVIIVLTVIFSKDMHEGFKACDEMEGVVSSIVQENLTGVRVVRAFGQERREKDRFEAKNDEYTNLWIRVGHLMGRFWCSQDVLTSLQTLLVLVLGAKFCIDDAMLPGEYVAFLSYNAMMSFPIRRIGRVVSEMSKAGVAIDRIAYVVNSEEEKDPEDSVKAPLDRDIVFDHVNFSYEGSKEILHDVSFTIPAGSTLGILGGTGSGKSTLMLLLDKMYTLPEGCGSIYIGDTDIRKIDTAYLRDNISIVLQEPYLYSRSLKENIGITDESFDLEAIREAARAACLDETIENFEKGYDTFVGERGVTLSGGQKQRTAIARALTKNAPIFIFDDSMSAVDTETDAKIRAALEEKFGTATIIIISHRITTLSKADNILVLDDGRVSEIGSPEKLRTSGGLYNQIFDIQSGSI